MRNRHEISMEISGPLAMFTDPSTGDMPVSYPVPTYSAVKGMFENILFYPTVEVKPVRIEICKPIKYHTLMFNYGGPNRHKQLKSNPGNRQVRMIVLEDVCYKVYAQLKNIQPKEPMSERAKKQFEATTNPSHSYFDHFNRRLRRGECFRPIFLGLKDFIPDYVGKIRNNTIKDESINLSLASMLYEIFPGGPYSQKKKHFIQNVQIVKGELNYSEYCHAE